MELQKVEFEKMTKLIEGVVCPRCGSAEVGFAIPTKTYDCACGHQWGAE